MENVVIFLRLIRKIHCLNTSLHDLHYILYENERCEIYKNSIYFVMKCVYEGIVRAHKISEGGI